jgi:ribosomal protein L37AE/L43A|tara:strand:- start:51 stop:617 length:567 start_codon:yes stop_codon:yes gene_type:complete
MAGKSKDAERENKALAAILKGEEVEKRSFVGYTPEAEKNEGGKTRKSDLTDIMAEIRMPWFCPECKKTMKKKLDDKFWRMMGHCFDCQVEYENKLRIKGEFSEWAQSKMLENQKAQLIDLEQSITDFEKTGGKKEWYNNVGVNTPMLEADKWEMGKEQFEKTISEARDFIREKRQLVEEAENQLQGTK